MKLSALVFTLLVSISVHATTYYFSASSGNDDYSVAQAQNPATPWKSIDKLNASFYLFEPGDSLLLKRGEVFDGEIIVKKSGTSSRPIVFSAYSNGEKPIVNGFITITNWTSAGGGVFESVLPGLETPVASVIINGQAQAIGRYPNSNEANKGYLTFESSVANTAIIDNQLTGSPNWTNGEVVIRKNRWVLDRNAIILHSGNKITYKSESPNLPGENFGYFIQNHPGTLDTYGEWYYNAGAKKLGIFLGSKSPASLYIQASAVNTLVTINAQSNIVFDNIVFKGASSNSFQINNSANISIKNCGILFSGADALNGANNNSITVENTSILNTNNIAINFTGSTGCRFRNNVINRTGAIAGMGKGDSGSYEAIMIDGNQHVIELNTIDSTGYNPITFRGNDNIISRNFISNYAFVKDDGGGIYSWNNIANAPPTYGTKITDNIVLNGIGAGAGTDGTDYLAADGIYMDDNSAGMEITGNTVANCGLYGIYLHNARDINLKANTVFNCRVQVVMTRDNFAPNSPIRNINLKNNKFVSKSSSQAVAEFWTSNNDIAQFGNFDSNYYARPIIDNLTIIANNKSYSLNEWKALYNKDPNSRRSPISINSPDDFRFEFNGSSAIKTITLSGNYVDLSNQPYSGSLTLDPYTSIVLMKQPAPAAGSSGCGSGQISYDQWNNYTGSLSSVSSQATSSYSGELGLFEAPTDFGDRYAGRIRGYICPPQSGNYTFWLAADDEAELWLSTNNNPTAKVKIAYVQSYTGSREWNKFANQKSAQIYLLSGQRYYIEALHKEGDGGDNMAVAWKLPSGDIEGPIAGSHLSPFTKVGGSVAVNQTITFNPLTNVTIGAGPVSLSASASSGLPVSFRVVSGPAIISGNSCIVSGVGTVVIEGSQSGNTIYNAAQVVVRNLVVMPAAVSCAATGTILFEHWLNVGGNKLPDINFNSNPSGFSQITKFEGLKNAANNYASRIRGYICPPISGEYTFWISGDDATELYLSKDDNPDSKIKIAYNLTWTGAREWNKFPSQQSAPVYLEAGNKYYIEALHKEGDGGDNLSVAWQLPSGEMEAPINGSRLSPFQVVAPTALNQTISFSSLADVSSGVASFTLAATSSSGLLVSFRVVSGAAVIVGKLCTILGLGRVTIEASQPGNIVYNAAPEITRTFNVLSSPITPICSASGTILREQWDDVDGNDLADNNFSKPATGSSQLTVFESRENISDNYASRISGYICAPVSGSYTFWIAGDDATELYLSTGGNAANKVRIAYSLTWTGRRDWNRFPTQQSAQVTLVAGKKYYIEARQKEGNGGDHLSVAWQIPGGAFEGPIPGSYLSPVVTVPLANQSITFSPATEVTFPGDPIVLSASSTSGLPVSFRLISGPAQIAGNVLTINAPGLIVVEAAQPGNDTFDAAPPIIKNINVSETGECSATGYILREYWNEVSGNNLFNNDWSASPSGSELLSIFKGPTNVADNYASRIRGYLCPPLDGKYIFWICGDDATELYLSSDANPDNKKKIAYNLSWTNPEEWNRYGTQRSVKIILQAGKKYYIEAIQKEGAGGDNLAVAWQMPNGSTEMPVPGSRLAPYMTEKVAKSNKQSAQQARAKSNSSNLVSDNLLATDVIKVFPNPMVQTASILFSPAKTGVISVQLVDLSGRMIKDLFTGLAEGSVVKKISFNSLGLTGGIYAVRIITEKKVLSQKLMVVR